MFEIPMLIVALAVDFIKYCSIPLLLFLIYLELRKLNNSRQ